jgi:CubicO group peptidase (beta-lactamase class C family)
MRSLTIAILAVSSLSACGARQSTPRDAQQALEAQELPLGQPPAPHFDRTPIDVVLQAFVDRGQIAGAEAIVFKDGREVYYGSFGYADREARRSMSRDTLIQIYSMSKPVTGVALMQLHEQGRFQLDDALEQYLPEFAGMKVYVGEGANGAPILEDARRQITVRDITRHTAGFGRKDDSALGRRLAAADPMNWSNTLPEMARRLASVPLAFHPGEKWLYGPSVDVQAYLVQKLAGVPYEEYANKHVLDPLGMRETSFYVAPERRDRCAAEYQLSDAGELSRTPDEEAFKFSSAEWPMDPGGFGWTRPSTTI